MNNITDTEKTQESKKKHHEFSPSNLERFALCPASWKMTKDLPETTNEYAEEGTMLHERCVDNFNTDGLTTEQAILIEKSESFLEVFQIGDSYKVSQKEIKLKIVDDNFQLITEGTADVVLLSENRKKAILIDWKFGRSKVTASKDNWQLAAYALGVAQKYGVSEVEAFIFQPKVYPDSSSYIFTDFALIQSSLEEAIKDCKRDALIFNAGEKQCTYCKFKAKCNAFNAKYSNIELIDNSLPSLCDISLTDLYKRFAMADKLIKQKFTEVKTELEARILLNGSCDGYELKAGSKTATINDADKMFEELKDIMLPSEFTKCCKIQKAALETIYINKVLASSQAEGKKVTKKDLKAEFKNLIAPFTTYKQNKSSIHLV